MNRNLAALAAFGLAALFAAGCSVDQKKEVATYRTVLDAGAREVAFEPDNALSLPQALDLVNRHNERLAMQGETYLQSLIDKDRAAAAFLPKVSFAPNYLREEMTHIPGVIEFAPPEAADVPFEAGLDVNLPRAASTVRSAREAARRERERLLDAQGAVFLDAAETYYQVLRSERQRTFLESSVEVQAARLANMRVKQKAGVARTLDVAQAEAQLAGTRASLVVAGRDVRNGRSVLALLAGVPRVDGPLTDELAAPDAAPTEDALLADARARRHDLRAAAQQVLVAERNLDAAWSRYFPTISLGASYYAHRESFPMDITWMGLASLDWPIFSAGLIHADVRTAYSQLRQAELARSYLERAVVKDLRVAREDYDSSGRRVAELRVQQAAAETALRNAEQGLAAGLNTHLDRLVAQDQVLQSGLELASEELARKVYYLRILRATGRLTLGSPDLEPIAAPEAAPADITQPKDTP